MKAFIIFCSIPSYHYSRIALKHLHIIFFHLLTRQNFSLKIIGSECYKVSLLTNYAKQPNVSTYIYLFYKPFI